MSDPGKGAGDSPTDQVSPPKSEITQQPPKINMREGYTCIITKYNIPDVYKLNKITHEPSEKKQKVDSEAALKAIISSLPFSEEVKKTIKTTLPPSEIRLVQHMNDFQEAFGDKYEPLDINNFIPIPTNLHEIEGKGVDMVYFAAFLNECLCKNVLQIFDHPSATRSGAYFQLPAKGIRGNYLDAVMHSFNWYRTKYPEGSKMTYKEVKRMRGSFGRYLVYYITYTVIDELGEERTIQAAVMEFKPGDWQLGMLRSSYSDKVAVIQFEEAPTGDTAVKISRTLDKVWKKVLLKTEM